MIFPCFVFIPEMSKGDFDFFSFSGSSKATAKKYWNQILSPYRQLHNKVYLMQEINDRNKS